MRRGKLAREARKERAELRQADRNARTSAEQIAVLDKRLGDGVGAIRERKRLARPAKNVNVSSDKVATTKSQRRREKAKRHAARKENGN